MSENRPQNKIKVATDKLEFDISNPRLVMQTISGKNAEEEVIKSLVLTSDISELIKSIVSNTYLDIEPLVVTEQGVKTSGNFRVLEGNRRLCAIKLLQNKELAEKMKISVPTEIPEDVITSLEEVTIYLVPDETAARSFIGFKHINGPHKWDSFAKAKFLVDWYITERENGITIDQIAQNMGDNNSTVRSLISGMLVLNQALTSGIYEIDNRDKPGQFGFSHLYTALGRNEYRDYLGLQKDWNSMPNENPVNSDHLENLKNTLNYIYGSKTDNIKSVIMSQNPDLKHLGEVLISSKACRVLFESNSLALAYEELRPPEEVFERALIAANIRTAEALQKLGKYEPKTGSELASVANELLKSAKIIHSTIISNIVEN